MWPITRNDNEEHSFNADSRAQF